MLLTRVPHNPYGSFNSAATLWTEKYTQKSQPPCCYLLGTWLIHEHFPSHFAYFNIALTHYISFTFPYLFLASGFAYISFDSQKSGAFLLTSSLIFFILLVLYCKLLDSWHLNNLNIAAVLLFLYSLRILFLTLKVMWQLEGRKIIMDIELKKKSFLNE